MVNIEVNDIVNIYLKNVLDYIIIILTLIVALITIHKTIQEGQFKKYTNKLIYRYENVIGILKFWHDNAISHIKSVRNNFWKTFFSKPNVYVVISSFLVSIVIDYYWDSTIAFIFFGIILNILVAREEKKEWDEFNKMYPKHHEEIKGKSWWQFWK